jgi:hypothetical protein
VPLTGLLRAAPRGGGQLVPELCDQGEMLFAAGRLPTVGLRSGHTHPITISVNGE